MNQNFDREGWNSDKVGLIKDVCNEIYNLSYEIESCIRGAYTGCHTYEELGQYVQSLAERLKEAGEETENELEDEPYEEYEY